MQLLAEGGKISIGVGERRLSNIKQKSVTMELKDNKHLQNLKQRKGLMSFFFFFFFIFMCGVDQVCLWD